MFNGGWRSLLNVLLPYSTPCIICSTPISAHPINDNSLPWLSQLKLEKDLCRQCIHEISWLDKVLCRRCGRSIRCPDCQHKLQSALWVNRSAVRYNEQMKQWLHRYKFQGDERLSILFGKMLLPAVEQVSLQLINRYG